MSLKMASSPSPMIVDGGEEKGKAAASSVANAGIRQISETKDDKEPVGAHRKAKEDAASASGGVVGKNNEKPSQNIIEVPTVGRALTSEATVPKEPVDVNGKTKEEAATASANTIGKSDEQPNTSATKNPDSNKGTDNSGAKVHQGQDGHSETSLKRKEIEKGGSYNISDTKKSADNCKKEDDKPLETDKKEKNDGRTEDESHPVSAKNCENDRTKEDESHLVSAENGESDEKKENGNPPNSEKKGLHIIKNTEANKAAENRNEEGGKPPGSVEHGASAELRPSDWGKHNERKNDSGFNVKHPYIGKRVRIKDGQYKGLTGKILEIKKRGLWIVDHPELKDQKIPSRSCDFVDTVEEGELREYYAQLNKKLLSGPLGSTSNSKIGAVDSVRGEAASSGTSTQDAQKANRAAHVQHESYQAAEAHGVIPNNDARLQSSPRNATEDAPKAETPEELRGEVPVKSRQKDGKDALPADKRNNDGSPGDFMSISSSDSPIGSFRRSLSPSDPSSQKKKRKLSPDSSHGQAPAEVDTSRGLSEDQAVDSTETVLISQLDMNGSTPSDASELSRLNYEQGGRSHVPTLPPVLLDAPHGDQLPASLAHLPANHKIDIFNRKTGKIMSGEEAVCVKDLSKVLIDHAEYEPIVPSRQASGVEAAPTQSFREGRSSARVRVSANINPQIRFENSSYDGKSVVVTKGPYSGLVGKVDACVPGGWYLIKGLFSEDDLELQLAIGADSLVLIPESNENKLARQADTGNPPNGKSFVKEFQGFLSSHFSSPIKILKLRVEALQQEKKALNTQLARLRLGKASNDMGAMAQTREDHRLTEQLIQVQGKLAKTESDLKEQLQSAATARIHVLQCFDQAVKEGT